MSTSAADFDEFVKGCRATQHHVWIVAPAEVVRQQLGDCFDQIWSTDDYQRLDHPGAALCNVMRENKGLWIAIVDTLSEAMAWKLEGIIFDSEPEGPRGWIALSSERAMEDEAIRQKFSTDFLRLFCEYQLAQSSKAGLLDRNLIRTAVTAIAAAWKSAFSAKNDDPLVDRFRKFLLSYIRDRGMAVSYTRFKSRDTVTRDDVIAWLEGDAREFAEVRGQVKSTNPWHDQGTLWFMCWWSFPSIHDPALRKHHAQFLLRLLAGWYGATLTKVYALNPSWIWAASEKRKSTQKSFNAHVEASWIASLAGLDAGARAATEALYKEAVREFVSEEECQPIRRSIDDPAPRAARLSALAHAGGSSALRVTVAGGLSLPLPFTIAAEPARLDPVGLSGKALRRSFAYRRAEPPPGEGWYTLSEDERRATDQVLKRFVAAIRSEGGVCDDGQGLAALHSAQRRRDRDGGEFFEFRLQRLNYLDYLRSNVVRSLVPNLRDALELAPVEAPAEEVWGVPRGSFFGLSAICETSDGFVILQVREGGSAADRYTLNTSVSGGHDYADLGSPDDPTRPFLELGLLREARSEISAAHQNAIEAGATLTFTGWLRNLHRAFLPELTWHLRFTHTDAQTFLQQYRKLKWGADEAEMETVSDDHKLPELLLIKKDLLLRHADKILDLGAFCPGRPTPEGGHVRYDEPPARDAPVFHWSFGWLMEHLEDWDRVRTSKDRHGDDPANARYGGDGDGRGRKGKRAEALAILATRQPALPLLATLGMAMRSGALRSDLGATPADGSP